MNFYVAAPFSEYERARAVMDQLTALGHTITYDWTRSDEFGADGHPLTDEIGDGGSSLSVEMQRKYAYCDIQGVVSADRIVVLADKQTLFGALIEMGVAIASNVDVIVVAPHRWSIFFSAYGVSVVDTVDEALLGIGPAVKFESSPSVP